MRRLHWHAVLTISAGETWSPPFDTKSAADSRASSIRGMCVVKKCDARRDRSRGGVHCMAEPKGVR